MALRITFVFFLCLTSIAAQGNPPTVKDDVVRYKATIDNVKYLFGVAPPVASVKPGNILEANSLDCFGNALQKPGDSFSLVKGDNPLTGPFYIEGAQPGDTLVVHILDLQVDGKQGVGTFGPGFGAANATHYTPMIETKPLPEKVWFYPIDADKNTATFQALDSNFKVSFPLRPFLGCIGVAPANGGSTQFNCPSGIWRQHGRAGSQQRQYFVSAGECGRGSVLFWRWSRRHG
jgi:acetamidase/formamidase